MRDDCPTTPPASSFCRPSGSNVTEACDGADLASATCASLGYGSGTLACDPMCGFDKTACSECVVDARVLSCGVQPVHADVFDFSIAATAEEIGLAWRDFENDGDHYYLTRLSPTLDVLGQVELTPPGPGDVRLPIAIAPFPSGWITTWRERPAIQIQPVDSNGAKLGALSLEIDAPDQILTEPTLVARPNAGPLLFWRQWGAVRGAIISDDGRAISPPQDLLVANGTDGIVSATFADGAFYVLFSVVDLVNGIPTNRNRLARIETDGTVGSAKEILPGVGLGQTTFVAGAPDLRVIYPEGTCGGPPRCQNLSGTWGLVWQKLTSTGEAAAAPVVLTDDTVHTPAAIGFGDDTLVALSDEATAGSALLMHVDASGLPAEATFAFTRAPGPTPYATFSLVWRGPDLVVASQPGNGIWLARVVP